MLATLTDDRFDDPGWLFERKLDGVRAIAARDHVATILWSRNQKPMDANFLVSYFFLQLIDLVGKPATFWIYGGLGVVAPGFFVFRIPETKDRSLERIEREAGGERLARRTANS